MHVRKAKGTTPHSQLEKGTTPYLRGFTQLEEGATPIEEVSQFTSSCSERKRRTRVNIMKHLILWSTLFPLTQATPSRIEIKDLKENPGILPLKLGKTRIYKTYHTHSFIICISSISSSI